MAGGRTAWLAEQEMKHSHGLTTAAGYPPATLEIGLFSLGVEAAGFAYSRQTIDNNATRFTWSSTLKGIISAADLTFTAPSGGNWGLIDELRSFVPGDVEYERFLVVDANGAPAPIQTANGQAVVFPAGTGFRRIAVDLPV